jgi:F0F1-type ATP synthase membrane subunit b/b'
MEETLHALGGIVVKAIPTFILVILLNFFLKYSFFGPLERILKSRYDASEGARKRAEETIARAEAKAAEYEAALLAARSEVYLEQEKLQVKLEQDRKAEVAAARASTEQFIRQARAELAADVEAAKNDLSRENELLANQIADTVLGRSMA